MFYRTCRSFILIRLSWEIRELFLHKHICYSKILNEIRIILVCKEDSFWFKRSKLVSYGFQSNLQAIALNIVVIAEEKVWAYDKVDK